MISHGCVWGEGMRVLGLLDAMKNSYAAEIFEFLSH